VDDFLKPNTIDLNIKMINPAPFESPRGELFYLADRYSLIFTEGSLRISGIDFNGTRENDNNYKFSIDFDNVLVANLSDNTMSQPVSFDIPEGSYKEIEITLQPSNQRNNSPAFNIQGNCQYFSKDPSRPYETKVECNFFQIYNDPLNLIVETEDGNKQVVFKEGNWDTLEVIIDLEYLFQEVNPRVFLTDSLYNREQQNITISEENNFDIYLDLATRVKRSIKAIIK
jgi:hypothetical protein